MTQSFIDMMALFSLGSRGKKAESTGGFNIDEIKRLSFYQKIWPTVYFALGEVTPEMLNMAMNKAGRQNAVYKIVEKLEKSGIPCCFLKGEILDDMYADPAIRLTSDTDLLINPDHEKAVIKIVKENGFLVHERLKTSNELKTTHKAAGLVEFHIALDNKQMSEVWFNNKFKTPEPFRTHISKANISYTTLSETDGLIFVFLHFVKHFISAVGNIKMIMDILMYMETYKDTINWEKFDNLISDLGYMKILNVIKYIGTKYLGFSYVTEDFSELSNQILTDMEESDFAEEQTAFYSKYTEIRYERFNGGNFSEYNKSLNRANFKKRYFPSRVTMIPKYPYLIKYPFLVPWAWFIRALNFVLKKENNVSPSDESNSRIELIKSLDLF